MNVVVAILIIIGICLIVASCIFFDREQKTVENHVVTLNDYELDEKQLEKLQENIKEVVKSYSDQLVEDTNRELSKLSSDKMMEVSDLAQQVLADIKKSHQECVFLYDMLEDKSTQLKEYVSNSAEKLFALQNEMCEEAPVEKQEAIRQALKEEESKNPIQSHLEKQVKHKTELKTYPEDLEGTEQVQKRNQKIMEMFKQGKEPITIAKEMNLGVGEVQLVVDLFQGDK